MDADPAGLVRFGYNAISRAYRSGDDPAPEYDAWLALLQERISRRGRSWTSDAAAASPSPVGWLPPGIG